MVDVLSTLEGKNGATKALLKKQRFVPAEEGLNQQQLTSLLEVPARFC